MINSLFSQNGFTPQPAYQQGINTQQADALKSVLSGYDASNISETDAKNIVSQVKDLGIAPGRPLTIVFAGEGFDAAAVGDKAGVGGGDRPAPPQGKGGPNGQGGPKGEVNTEALSALKLLVDAKEGEDISETEWTAFYEELEEQGIDTSKPFIDLKL